jgi:hypothetical protein
MQSIEPIYINSVCFIIFLLLISSNLLNSRAHHRSIISLIKKFWIEKLVILSIRLLRARLKLGTNHTSIIRLIMVEYLIPTRVPHVVVLMERIYSLSHRW